MFGSLMNPFGDDDGDHIGSQMRNMNNMINSMFTDPFNMMGRTFGRAQATGFESGFGAFGDPMGGPMGGFMGGPMGNFMPPMMQMPNMNALMNSMQGNGNCHSYSSSSVMSMTNGPDGRPQVYHETSSSRSAPGGVRETKKSVCDSRRGVKKLAIGHSIGDKAHIIEKEQDLRSGEMEERQDFINLDEEESEAFNREWQQKTRQAQFQSLNYPQLGSHDPHNRHNHRDQMLALPEFSNTHHRRSGGDGRHRK